MNIWNRIITFLIGVYKKLMMYINLGIHESNSFLPTDIAGMTVWFKANAIVGLNDGDLISTWEDSSSNNNDATAAGSDRPVYKTNILNSLPVVRCSATKLLLGTKLTTTKTVFAVINRDGGTTPTGYQGIIQTNYFGLYSCLNAFSSWGLYRSADINSTVAINTTFKVLSVVYTSDSDIDLVTNSSVVNISSGGTAYGYTNHYIGFDGGGAQHHKGDIAEIIGYDSTLNDTDRDSVITYLMTKYAL